MKKIIFILSVLSFINCNKTPGCTDIDAENYWFEAEEDDGSCYYLGNVVFYQDAQSSDNLLADGVTYLKLYIDDVFTDRMQANTRFSFIPTCEHPDAMKLGNHGGSDKSKSYSYKIKDQNDNVLLTGIFLWEGSKCNSVKFSY